MISRMYGALAEASMRTLFELWPLTLTLTSVDPLISKGAKQTTRSLWTEMICAQYPLSETLVPLTESGSWFVASNWDITVLLGPRFCPAILINSPGAIPGGN